MRRFVSRELMILAAGVALLVGSLGAKQYFRVEKPIEGIKVEPAGFDFGHVAQSETLAHTFRLKNGSKTTIEIVKVESSCSCTTTQGLDGQTIGPGQGIDVPLTLKTGTDDGGRTGTITLYYRAAGRKDAPQGFAVARVAADVVPDYRIRPTLIDFGKIDDLDPVTRTIRLRPVADSTVKILDIRTTDEAVVARQIPAPDDSKDIHVELTFSGRTLWASRPMSAVVMIHTSSRGAPTAEVMTRAQFQAPVEAEPAAIVVGSGEPKQVEREVKITASRPVRLTALRCSDPHVTLTPTGPTLGKVHIVKVALGDAVIRAEAAIEVQPEAVSGATEARTLTIPIHRLAEGIEPR